jgi:hypothetical protein
LPQSADAEGLRVRDGAAQPQLLGYWPDYRDVSQLNAQTTLDELLVQFASIDCRSRTAGVEYQTSESAETRRALLVVQNLHRIEAGSVPRGDIRGKETNSQERQTHRSEYDRIKCTDVVKEASQ